LRSVVSQRREIRSHAQASEALRRFFFTTVTLATDARLLVPSFRV